MNALGRAGLVVLVSCGIGAIASGWCMAVRIRDYYRDAPPPEFFFKPTVDRSFSIDGMPVSLTDEHTPDGRAAMRLRYGQDEAIFPVIPPPVDKFKDLSGYEESLRVLAFAPIRAGQVETEIDGNPAVRIIVISRTPAPGREAEPGALVGSKLWTFQIFEFVRGGGLVRRMLQFPDRRGNLPAVAADPSAGVEQIRERTWEWQAALWAMPKLYASRYKYKTDAFEGMGWTLPAAAFGMLGVLIGTGLVLMDRAGPRPRAA